MEQKTLVVFIASLGAIVIALLFIPFVGVQNKFSSDGISSFAECIEAGNPIMESFPRQCKTEDGSLFVENLNLSLGGNEPQEQTRAQDGCFIGGCSNQVCSDQAGLVTTCEYLDHYVCYQDSVCKRDDNDQCGWEITEDLLLCLSEKGNDF